MFYYAVFKLFKNIQHSVTPENLEETVATLSAMGFPRDQVEAALKACNNNPDMALHYLEGGAVAQQSVC